MLKSRCIHKTTRGLGLLTCLLASSPMSLNFPHSVTRMIIFKISVLRNLLIASHVTQKLSPSVASLVWLLSIFVSSSDITYLLFAFFFFLLTFLLWALICPLFFLEYSSPTYSHGILPHVFRS